MSTLLEIHYLFIFHLSLCEETGSYSERSITFCYFVVMDGMLDNV